MSLRCGGVAPEESVLAVNKRDKGKKGPLATSDNFELLCGESVKLSEQRLTEHEASFHFCFYRGNSRPNEILLRVNRDAIEHIVCVLPVNRLVSEHAAGSCRSRWMGADATKAHHRSVRT